MFTRQDAANLVRNARAAGSLGDMIKELTGIDPADDGFAVLVAAAVRDNMFGKDSEAEKMTALVFDGIWIGALLAAKHEVEHAGFQEIQELRDSNISVLKCMECGQSVSGRLGIRFCRKGEDHGVEVTVNDSAIHVIARVRLADLPTHVYKVKT